MPALVTRPYGTSSTWLSDLDPYLHVNGRADAAYVGEDGMSCYAPLDNEAQQLLARLSPEDVKLLHEANVDGDGGTLLGAVELLGAASTGVFAGAHGMGRQYIGQMESLQQLLDKYRDGDRVKRATLRPQIEAAHANITRQYAAQLERAARERSVKASRNPYRNPQRAMNMAADGRRQINLVDNRDIRRMSSFLQNAKYLSGVGTVLAVGATTHEAYGRFQRGEEWQEEAFVSFSRIGGAAAGAALVTMAIGSGPVGWVILGAGAAGMGGSVVAGAGARTIYGILNR